MSGFTSTWNSKVTGPGLPLQVVDVRVGDGLELFLLQRHAPALADQLLEGLLPDVVGELLSHDPCRGLAAAESRESRAPLVVGGGALLGLAHVLGRHGHGERRRARLLAGLLDLDVGHDDKSNCVGSGEWYLAVRAEAPVLTVAYDSPLPTQ